MPIIVPSIPLSGWGLAYAIGSARTNISWTQMPSVSRVRLLSRRRAKPAECGRNAHARLLKSAYPARQSRMGYTQRTSSMWHRHMQIPKNVAVSAILAITGSPTILVVSVSLLIRCGWKRTSGMGRTDRSSSHSRDATRPATRSPLIVHTWRTEVTLMTASRPRRTAPDSSVTTRSTS